MSGRLSPEEQLRVLSAKAAEVISREELLRKLRRAEQEGRPLRVKLGLDPTAPHLHLGHMVVVQKLREFQQLGHETIFLIGDFTGMIGDPSSRSETRQPLSIEQVRQNAETYKAQICKVLDPDRTRIEFNSRWMGPMTAQGLIELAAHYTVARLLERDDFRKRYESGFPIGVHEFLYPLIQGYDSVVLRADVELGGTDQTFNLLVGRELQRDFGQEPQVVLTLPILEGLDGVQKMSKSLGNTIALEDPPQEIFGKVMSIPDELLMRYYELTSPLTIDELDKVRSELEGGLLHPREAKFRLAKTLVALYHSRRVADEAAAGFDRIFKERKAPTVLPPYYPPAEVVGEGGAELIGVLVASGAVATRSAARRLIQQGGVRIDGKPVRDEKARISLESEHVLKVGKRAFLRVCPPGGGKKRA